MDASTGSAIFSSRSTRNLNANKENAIEFYRLAYLGDPTTAVERFVGAEYIQPRVSDPGG